MRRVVVIQRWGRGGGGEKYLGWWLGADGARGDGRVFGSFASSSQMGARKRTDSTFESVGVGVLLCVEIWC